MPSSETSSSASLLYNNYPTTTTTMTIELLDADCAMPRKKRCPLHKQIRNQNWDLVRKQIRIDPSLLHELNGVGWSSLILAVYHMAPDDLIAEMIHLANQTNTQHRLLSHAVPTGNRLCLHFATRFSSSVEVLRILTEPYPRALLHKSEDGATPLDRAIYYRKDQAILSFLQAATKREEAKFQLEQYNLQLRRLVTECCETNRQTQSNQQLQASTECHAEMEETARFVIQVYTYAAEREMIGLFDNVLSYVGVYAIPRDVKC